VKFAILQIERYAVQSLYAGKFFGDVLHFEQRHKFAVAEKISTDESYFRL
jgi:hypothetical protein